MYICCPFKITQHTTTAGHKREYTPKWKCPNLAQLTISLPGVMWLVSVTRSQVWRESSHVKFGVIALTLLYWSVVTGSSTWHLMAKNSEDLKKRIVTYSGFNRTGSTQNRPRYGRPKKLSAHAQCHIQRLCLGNRRMSAASIAFHWLKGWGVSLSVLRPCATHCIKFICMAVIPEVSLFKRWCTRKPANSLLRTSRLRTWITRTMSCGLMRPR